MEDDDTPAPVEHEVEARARLLAEQEARIAALRAAVLSGRVPDEATFDYERFFAGSAEPETPER